MCSGFVGVILLEGVSSVISAPLPRRHLVLRPFQMTTRFAAMGDICFSYRRLESKALKTSLHTGATHLFVVSERETCLALKRANQDHAKNSVKRGILKALICLSLRAVFVLITGSVDKIGQGIERGREVKTSGPMSLSACGCRSDEYANESVSVKTVWVHGCGQG